MIVDVYRNLTKRRWSVRNRKTGLVVLHRRALVLRTCTFHVSSAGRERVRREGRKNVHAVVRGELTTLMPPLSRYYACGYWAIVHYNPYVHECFVDYSVCPVVGALLVEFRVDGSIRAHGTVTTDSPDFPSNLTTVV